MASPRKPARLGAKLRAPEKILGRRTQAMIDNPGAAIGAYSGLLGMRPGTAKVRALSKDLLTLISRYLHQRTNRLAEPPIADEVFLLEKLTRAMEGPIRTGNLRDRTELLLSQMVPLLSARIAELKRATREGQRKDTDWDELLPAFAECCSDHIPDATRHQIMNFAADVFVDAGLKPASATSSRELRKRMWPLLSDADMAAHQRGTKTFWLKARERAATK